MKYRYAKKDYNKENMARVVGKTLSLSTKFSTEICRFIRGKKTSEAKEILKGVVERKVAIPFKRYHKRLSHKRKIGPGRYPRNASLEIIKLLESAEANAQFKGLNTSNLQISHICAHLAGKQWHYGRQRRTRAKRTHIEIVVEEKKPEAKKEKVEKTKNELKN